MAQQAGPRPALVSRGEATSHATVVTTWSLAAVERSARDPGGLRMTQGLKTVLAVLLFLLVQSSLAFLPVLRPLYSWTSESLVRGAIAVGFLMQCGEGKSLRQRQVTMGTTGLVMIVLAFVGALLDGYHEIKDALLVLVAFLMFYVRRFIVGKPSFTSYVFVICLLSCMFPGGLHVGLTYAAGLTGALVMAFVVFFDLRPPDMVAAFAETGRARCAALAYLLQPARAPTAKRARRAVVRLGVVGQALVEAAPPGPRQQRAEAVLRDQIDLWQMVQMYLDSMAQIEKAGEPPADLTPRLKALEDSLSRSFAAVAEDRQDDHDHESVLEALEQWALDPTTLLCPTLTHVGAVLLGARRLGPGIKQLGQDLERLEREKAL